MKFFVFHMWPIPQPIKNLLSNFIEFLYTRAYDENVVKYW